MSEALQETKQAPSGEALGEHNDLPNPQTNTIPADDAAPGEKRSNAVNKAVDDVLGSDDEKPKAKTDPKAKPDEKPAVEKPVAEKAKSTDPDKEKPPATEKATDPAKEAKPAPDEPPAVKPRATAYRDAPAGFDEGAKAEWDAVPESVRGAMHRRQQELEQGVQKYRAEAQEYEPVRKYADMAKQSGTTLDKALDRYVTLENKLRQDPMGGLEAVVANLGLKKQDGTQVTLRDVAASIMGQTPNQTAARQEATIQQLTRQLHEVTQKLDGFSQHVEGQKRESQTQTLLTEWNGFVAQNPRASELEGPIAEFLTKYRADDSLSVNDRLKDAYDWAVARHPNVAHTDEEPLVQTQTVASHNPAGQKSISGAPGGADAKTVSRNLNRSAAVEKAIRAAGL